MKRTLPALLLALWALPALPQQVGQRLYDLGYFQTVALADGTGKRITGSFNPAVPVGPGSSWDAILARYGFAAIPFGYLRGPEDTDAEILTKVIQRYQLWGLAADYVATEQDRTDVLYLASGTSNVWATEIDPLVPSVIPQPVSLSVGGPSSGQVGQSYTYTASAGGCEPGADGWSWSVEDGAISGGGTTSSISVTWPAAGYKAVIAANSACGSARGARNVTITDPNAGILQADFTFSPAAPKPGDAVSFDASLSVGGPTEYRWQFGDGTAGSGKIASHAYTTAGSFLVMLTLAKPGTGCSFEPCVTEATLARTVAVAESSPPAPPPPPVPTAKSVVLPWIAQTRAALVQSSDLYIHNPGASPMEVILEFRKRGAPEANPPRSTQTIQPGATLYVADVLRELFNRENVAGFISVTAEHGEVEPVITSFNTTFQPDGKQFGQTVAGVSMSHTGSAASAGTGSRQHLVGLIDNAERLAYFGISNPSDQPATYHLRFFDKTGRQIGESSTDLSLSRFGQRQFQEREIREVFDVTNVDDYRIEIETKSGGRIIPYGSNLRSASADPSFIEPGTPASRVYLVGVLSAPGLNNSLWQTDVLLSNTTAQPVAADLTFTALGLNATPTSALHLTLPAGRTERLANVIAGQWGIKNAIGVLTVDSAAAGGAPIVQGESYENTDPAKRFGQSMTAVGDADAAAAGEAQYLVGLRQDAKNRTTVWLFNPGSATAEYDVVYRSLDGKVLGTVAGVRLGSGRMRQFGPGQHPLPAAGVANGFTVQIVVKGGKLLSAAQVINNLTNDPAYIQGEVR